MIQLKGWIFDAYDDDAIRKMSDRLEESVESI